MDEFWLFAMVGFFAQLLDGALGMGYGIIAASTLFASGVPPAQVSANVHAAKLPTTAMSGLSHLYHGNIDRALFWRLALPGSVAAMIGAVVLTNLPGAALRPYVLAGLCLIGLLVILRALRPARRRRHIARHLVPPLGAAGGLIDAIGGGGWGPVVTSSLIGGGGDPRFAVGTTNAAEFVVTLAVVVSFGASLFAGHWQPANELMHHAVRVGGLICGGLPAALIAGWLLKKAPKRPLTLLVGLLVTGSSGWQLVWG